MVVADRQREVIERGQRVAVFGLESGQNQPPDVTRWRGCRCLERSPGPGAGPQARGRDRRRGRRTRRRKARTQSIHGLPVASAASIRPFAAAIASSPEPANCQGENQACPGESRECRDRVRAGRGTTRPTVRAGRCLGTHAPSQPSMPYGTSSRPLPINGLAGVAVADAVFDPSGRVAHATPSRTGARAGDGRRRGRAR